MTSLLNIGLIMVAATVLLVLVDSTEADEDVKRKRVIIKIPHRVKHIYHHHTKKVHVHKKKPKPKPKEKKPHKHVRVVVEEEEIVQPIKSWKSMHGPYKGGMGWDDWKAAPSGFKYSVKQADDSGYNRETTHLEEEFSFENDHDTRESRTHGRPSFKKPNTSKAGPGGKRGRKKGGRPSSSYRGYDDTAFEGSYETYHHHDQDEDYESERPRRKPKSKMSNDLSAAPRPRGRGSHPSRSTYRPTRRPSHVEKYHEPDEYDELYDRGPSYPERKEHPSWHERSKNSPHQEGPAAVGSEQGIWNLPNVPEVSEYIDDVHDSPDPGVTYGNGGFYPSAYNPITTITSSVVESNPPPVPPAYSPPNGHFQDFPANPGFQSFPINGEFHDGYRPSSVFDPAAGRPPVPEQPQPIAPIQPLQQHRPVNKKHKKNPGYVSKVSQTNEGLTVSYQSHIGHSSDAQSPSSSFQSVSYGAIKPTQ